MHKITPIEKAVAEIYLIVEGRLMGPWVEELQVTVMSASCKYGRVSLDLSGVPFVYAHGLRLLHDLLKQDVVLQAVSPFVQELLNTSPLL